MALSRTWLPPSVRQLHDGAGFLQRHMRAAWLQLECSFSEGVP
jgi:hypothetical protein